MALLFFFYRLFSAYLGFIPSGFLREAGSDDQLLQDYSNSPGQSKLHPKSVFKKMISLEPGAYLPSNQTL